MSAYENLVHYYSDLFPLSEKVRGFLAPSVERWREAALPWLDAGAGTGNLMVWLEASGIEAHGLEPDPEFAAEAMRRVKGPPDRLVRGSMQDLGELYKVRQFGAMTCIGNVLAHVESLDEARAFFEAAARALVPDGELLVQIVNYDRVLARQAWEFPPLKRTAADGTLLEFARKYEPLGDRLRFTTALQAGNVKIRNEALLFPLRRSELEAAALDTFAGLKVMGDFGEPWSESAPATILHCALPRRLG